MLTLVVIVMLGPVVEEIIYRGFMMIRLQKSVPIWLAVAFTANDHENGIKKQD